MKKLLFCYFLFFLIAIWLYYARRLFLRLRWVTYMGFFQEIFERAWLHIRPFRRNWKTVLVYYPKKRYWKHKYKFRKNPPQLWRDGRQYFPKFMVNYYRYKKRFRYRGMRKLYKWFKRQMASGNLVVSWMGYEVKASRRIMMRRKVIGSNSRWYFTLVFYWIIYLTVKHSESFIHVAYDLL